MSDDIRIFGIETNNLKNIDVTIKKHSINLILGPSGSGKSSLAYDTVSQIGVHELNSMYSDNPRDPDYKVKAFENFVSTVPIKQTNLNTNIRSSIGTYFNLSHHISLIYSTFLSLPYEYFVLNKESNVCEECLGLGIKKELDLVKIIDYSIPLEKCPFKCWNRYKDFYIAIITKFCDDNNINKTKTFKELSSSEKKKILFGMSEKKYTIKYKKTGSYHSRTTKFHGVMTTIPMLPNMNVSNNFFTNKTCPLCNGEKFSKAHRKFIVNGLSIGDLLCTPFSDLLIWIKRIKKSNAINKLDFSISILERFLEKAIELNLSYLFFNRTIPSLSGGELQRLRLVQVFNTQLTDLLIVLDEPLAGLSKDEKLTVYKNITQLAQKHTILVVDHHRMFINDAANIIVLGEKCGKYGGHIINKEKYLKEQGRITDFTVLKNKKMLNIAIENPIFLYKGININIAYNRLNLISGKSGIGKSTLIREYLPQYFDNYVYISQKNLVGNSNSYVATVLNISNPIAGIFSEEFSKDKKFFSNQTGCEGACKTCSGSGKIQIGNQFQELLYITCKDCNGSGYDNKLIRYKIDGLSIIDLWSLTLEESKEFFKYRDKKVFKVIQGAENILLGHLRLGQETSTLSGGENIRIKILKTIFKKTMIFGIDEPFRGLNNTEIYRLIIFLDSFIKQGKTIIIVDHEETSFKYFSNHLILINEDGILTSKDSIHFDERL